MNLASVLMMLLGAALVSVGVLSNALADRIRGLRPATREVAARTPAPRAARAPIEVVETKVVEAPPPPPARGPRPAIKPQGNDSADDVITALVAAGYKKQLATEAVWGCTQDERSPVERWTRAALKRAARGGAS